jgi:hypothetical protein
MNAMSFWTRVRVAGFFAVLFAVGAALGVSAALLLPYGRVWNIAVGVLLFLVMEYGAVLGLVAYRRAR